MKTRFNYLIVLSLIFMLSNSNCSNEDDISETFNLVCGEWLVTNIQFEVTLGGQNFVDYLMETYGLNEGEAQDQLEETENAYRESWTGTMKFKQDGNYEFDIGGENYSGAWALSDDEKTIHVLLIRQYMNFNIISVDEKMMKLRFDQVYYADIDDDGNMEAIDYNNDFTLEK